VPPVFENPPLDQQLLQPHGSVPGDARGEHEVLVALHGGDGIQLHSFQSPDCPQHLARRGDCARPVVMVAQKILRIEQEAADGLPTDCKTRSGWHLTGSLAEEFEAVDTRVLVDMNVLGLPGALLGYASGVKDFRPFLSVALVLIALSAALLIGPAFAASPILAMPDRRGIPQLVTRERDVIRYGTGFVVSPETVLTAKHAVAGAVEIIFPTGRVTGHVQCRAPDRDTAVIAARLPKDTPRYRVAFRTLAVGELVRIGGYPGRTWTVAAGRVTNVIKTAILSGRRINTPMVVFKPALHQGASGSPVLDARGYVVGIFVASNPPENYSIALPITTGLGPCRPLVKEGAAPTATAG